MSISTSMVTQGFFAWMDRALSQSIPHTTVAFHINLYEGESSVHVQLVGAESFVPGEGPERAYWPGAETFFTVEDIFEIPFSVAGSEWPEWLKTSIGMVSSYLAEGAKAGVLRSSKGVGIGFVDGDMHVLWQSAA